MFTGSAAPPGSPRDHDRRRAPHVRTTARYNNGLYRRRLGLLSPQRTPGLVRLPRAAILMLMALHQMKSSRIRAVEMLELMARSASGRYHISGNTNTVQCVIALDFGYRLIRTGIREPGPCNEYLASLALITGGDRPVIAQVEIDRAIRSIRPESGADHLIDSARDRERYLDTHEFAVQAHSIMSGHGWKTAALIAHPHHLPRAQAVFASRGIETVTPAGVRPIWDCKSCQPWTRGPLHWATRELFAIWLYHRRGWLSALG